MSRHGTCSVQCALKSQIGYIEMSLYVFQQEETRKCVRTIQSFV
jgi:hypothetical protein